MRPAPNIVKLGGERNKQRRLVRDYAVFEVAAERTFRPHPRTGQVRAAEIGDMAIRDHAFEMDAGAQHAVDARPKPRETVEIRTEVRSRLLRVDQPDFD